MDLTIFAKRLREARESYPMSQKDLANAIGVTPTTISAYEKSDGERGKKPTLENAQNIASVLGASLDWLCGLSDDRCKDVRTIDVLKGFALLLSNFSFEVNEYERNNYVQPYTEYSLSFIDNYRLYEFINEYKKIESFLNDEKYPDYLKNGLQNALFEKYKNFKIIDNQLLSPEDIENINAKAAYHYLVRNDTNGNHNET